ncbi:hypothetical protein SLA2020_017260 [Shorea laevis]
MLTFSLFYTAVLCPVLWPRKGKLRIVMDFDVDSLTKMTEGWIIMVLVGCWLLWCGGEWWLRTVEDSDGLAEAGGGADLR